MTTPEISFKLMGDERPATAVAADPRSSARTFFKPCSLKCEVYLYALEETQKKGNKISVTVEEDKR